MPFRLIAARHLCLLTAWLLSDVATSLAVTNQAKIEVVSNLAASVKAGSEVSVHAGSQAASKAKSQSQIAATAASKVASTTQSKVATAAESTVAAKSQQQIVQKAAETIKEPRSVIEDGFPRFQEFMPTMDTPGTAFQSPDPNLLGIPEPPSNDQLVFPRFRASATTGAEASASVSAGVGAESMMAVSNGVMDDSAGGEQSEASRLVNALGQLNLDITSTSQQVIQEDKWIKDVSDVIGKYMKKINNVRKGIHVNRESIKKMLQKKRQIENLILQKKLDAQLKDANSDLATLTSAMDSVKGKERKYQENYAEMKGFVQKLTTQISKLRGEPPPRPGQAGGAEGMMSGQSGVMDDGQGGESDGEGGEGASGASAV